MPYFWGVPPEPIGKHPAIERTRPDPNANPILALLRMMISSAFRDARRCAHGAPTDVAMDAVEWLMEDAPSKYVTPIGSFPWCCSFLDLDPKTVREHGLPQTKSVYMAGGDKTHGLAEVFQVWAQHRAQYLAAGGHDVLTEQREARAKKWQRNRRQAAREATPTRASATQDAPRAVPNASASPNALAVPFCAKKRQLDPFGSYQEFCARVGVVPLTAVRWGILSAPRWQSWNWRR